MGGIEPAAGYIRTVRLHLLTLALIACSPKAPAPGEARPSQGAPAVAPGAGSAAAAAVPAPDPREKALATTVTQLLEQEHLLRKKIDDDVSTQAFKTYIDALDAGKMFLLESRSRRAREVHRHRSMTSCARGALDLAHEGAKVYAARVAVVEKMVDELLAKPLDLTNEEFVEIDPEKVELAATEQELTRALAPAASSSRCSSGSPAWKRASSRRCRRPKEPAAKGSADDDDDEDGQVDDADRADPDDARGPRGQGARRAREDVRRPVRAPQEPGPARRGLRRSSTRSPPRSIRTPVYLPPADKANFDIRMSGSLEGIGAVLREKEHLIEIVELVPGGASWRQGGLAARRPDPLGRSRRSKDPVDVFDMRIDEVVKMIRGPKGTVVRLRVQKPDRHRARRSRSRATSS